MPNQNRNNGLLGMPASGSSSNTTTITVGSQNRSCAGIQFSESEGNVNIQIDSGFRFVNTFSPSSGLQIHSECTPVGSVALSNVVPNEQITVSGLYGTPTLEQGTGTLNWEEADCGTEDIPKDTSIYFFYDRTSLSDQELIVAGQSAKAWVDSLDHNGQVFHIQITGGRWIQWAEFPKTGMFGGLFGDSTQTTTAIQVNIGNVISYTGNGTSANPYVFDLEQSASLYPSNETGVLWDEANIAVGNIFGDNLSAGTIYDGTPTGIPDLRANSKNVLVVNLLNEASAFARTKQTSSLEVGWADYHSIGPGSQVFSGYLGVVTKSNWANGSNENTGWPSQTSPILPGASNNNVKTIYEAASNAALTYKDQNNTYTAASAEYVNHINYFEAWKQSAFYNGSDPYNGSVRPTKMADELQFNGSIEYTASWERDYRRFVFLYNNYNGGLINTTYAQDVLDGFTVNFITYAVRPANITAKNIAFPLHVVGAITDNATYTNSSNVEVTTTGGTIEQNSLPTNDVISYLTDGVVTTLTPLTYIGPNNISNGQNPYFDSSLGQLSRFRWGYNVEQDVKLLSTGGPEFEIFFKDDLNTYLDSDSCNNTDCLKISIINESTGESVPNFQISLPGSPLSPLVTDSNGEVFYSALPAGPYSVMDCYQFNSLGSCINWKMTLTMKECSYQADGYSACTDPTACNYDAEAQYEDGSCYFADCNGDCDGTAFIDECGNCVEGNTGLEENYAKDECGVCDGGNIDVDECGECFGNNSECAGCTDPTSKNYDPTAIIDDGSCSCSVEYYECILKEMAKEIVKDCSEKCYGTDCEEYNSSLYEDFRTIDSLLTQVKTYNSGICSGSSKDIVIEAIKTIELLTSDWNCSNCKNC